MPKSNHERDLVSFSFLVRNGTSREKRDVENSREKRTRLKNYYPAIDAHGGGGGGGEGV